jgi:tellurite resistance protein TerB
MSFLNKLRAVGDQVASQLKTTTSELSLRLSDEVKKYKNKEFLVALVTATALVALADGNIDQAERTTLANYLRISEELSVFDGQEVVEEFTKAVALFDFDRGMGEVEALKRISKIKKNVEASRTLVRVCISLANSDGNFDQKEKDVITLIVKELGLNPSDFPV